MTDEATKDVVEGWMFAGPRSSVWQESWDSAHRNYQGKPALGNIPVAIIPRARWDALVAAEAERDKFRDTLLARHGGEPMALLSELDEAREQIAALKARLAEVEQDAERLDWLDRHAFTAYRHRDPGNGKVLHAVVVDEDRPGSRTGNIGKDIRRAIDAAIAAGPALSESRKA